MLWILFLELKFGLENEKALWVAMTTH